MTEREAIEVFKELLVFPYEMLDEYDSDINEEQKKALVRVRCAEEMAIGALEEIQQYRGLERELRENYQANVDIKMLVQYFVETIFKGEKHERFCILTNEDADSWYAYKTAKEQGLLHKAPLKNGTPIWFFLYEFDEGPYITSNTYLFGVTEYEIGEIGKKFWLSEAEAEAALAKIKGE